MMRLVQCNKVDTTDIIQYVSNNVMLPCYFRVYLSHLCAKNVEDLDCCHARFAMEAKNLYTETILRKDSLP